MKYKNQVKKLQARQKLYDDMVAKDSKLKTLFKRPGSVKKG